MFTGPAASKTANPLGLRGFHEKSARAVRHISRALRDDAPEPRLGARALARRAWRRPPRWLVIARGDPRRAGLWRGRYVTAPFVALSAVAAASPVAYAPPPVTYAPPVVSRLRRPTRHRRRRPTGRRPATRPRSPRSSERSCTLLQRSLRAPRRRSAPAVTVGLGAVGVTGSAASTTAAAVDVARPSEHRNRQDPTARLDPASFPEPHGLGP
jgi:hypothetical protein